MIRKILIALIFINLWLPTSLSAAMDFLAEESLSQSLERMEKLYIEQKWDEAMEVGRGIIKDSPKQHPARSRAQDLIVLSLDSKNKELIRNQHKQKQQNDLATARKLAQEANKLLSEKKYKQAATKFSKAVRLSGGDAQTYYLLGYAWKNAGSKKNAYKAFKKSLKLNPKHTRSLFHLAGLSYEYKFNSEAEKLCAMLISAIDKRMEDLKEIFIEQKEQQLNDKAIETTRKMAALKKNLAQATYMHGILTEKRKAYKKSLVSFRRASKLQPTSADTWHHLGSVLLSLKIYHQATLALEQASFIRESKLKDLRNLAKKLLDEGKADAAVNAEIKTKALKKKIAETLYVLGIANGKRKETETAIDNINKALALNPSFVQARYAKSVFLAEKNRFDEALIEMKKVLKAAPPKSKQAKKAIKTITFLMDMIAKRNNPIEIAAAEKKKKTVEVHQYVKNMPGIGGKKQEERWEEIFPLLRNVKKMVSMNNIPEAIRRLIYMRTKYPEVTEIHCILGQCYMEQGRFKDAEKCFKQALDLKADHTESLANLAYIFASLEKNLETALDYAKQAVAKNGLKAEYHHSLGWVQFKMGEVQAAKLSFNRAVELKPDYLLARYNLGLTNYITKDFTQALDAFEQVLVQNPAHHKALMFKGISLAKLGKATEALKTLEDLREKLPKKSTLDRVVSNLHSKLKLAHERHAELPIPKIASPAPIKKLLAEAAKYRSQGLVTRAKEKYLECQRLAPDRFEPHYELGEMYARAGLNTAAVSAWEKALELNPDYFLLQLNMGKMLQKLGRKDKARECFVKAQSLNETDPEAKYYLGLMSYEEKRFESAESHALAALRIKRKFYKAMALLGMARMRLGRLKPARDIYETLYASAPNNSSIKRHARKKIWELTRMMAPGRFPSIEDAMDVKEKVVKKITGSEKGNRKFKPAPADAEAFKQYGANTMTVDDKMWVLKQLEKFSSVPTPTPIAPLRKKVTKQTLTSKEKQWMLKKLQNFGSQTNKYSLPAETKESKFSLNKAVTRTRQPDKSDEITKEAIKLATKGFTAQALAEFKKAQLVSPDNMEVLINVGYLNTILGNFKDAFDAFAQASVSHPNDPLPKLALGNLYWLGGQAEKATEQWEKMRGKLYIDKEFTFLAKSEKIWKRMLEVLPTDVDAHSNLGMVYMFSGKFKEALAEFQAVKALDENRKEHDFYSAQAYVIMYLKNKNKQHKKEAKTILSKLNKGAEPFPHSKRLMNYVKSL